MLTDPPDDLRSALRERSLDRVNSRNGYRGRDFDTRAGTIELAVPKLRFGTYFPDWLLERRRGLPAAGGRRNVAVGVRLTRATSIGNAPWSRLWGGL